MRRIPNMNITKQEFTLPSTDGVHTLACCMWTPDIPVRGVIHVVHGMVEHIGRYEYFARKMAERGYCVCGDDHLGHGKTAADPSEFGYFGEKDGYLHLVRDEEVLRRHMRTVYRHAPYIMLGHSMGSFIARAYAVQPSEDYRARDRKEDDEIPRLGHGLDGLIICGTAGTQSHLSLGMTLCRAVASLRGKKYRSRLIERLAGGAFQTEFSDEKDAPHSWLCKDFAVRQAYANDPMCQFSFTVGGYLDLFTLLRSVTGAEWASKIPKSLPILVIAGEDDPVGNSGKGPREVYSLLEEAEVNELHIHMYENCRHEILNEPEKDTVISDIANFCASVTDGVAAAEGASDGTLPRD